MRDERWGSIELKRWREVPHVTGRRANEVDIEAGRAVFWSYYKNTAHPMPLPATAILQESVGAEPIAVVVIQAELFPYGVVAGYRKLGGGRGVCMLEQLEIVPESDPRFRAA